MRHEYYPTDIMVKNREKELIEKGYHYTALSVNTSTFVNEEGDKIRIHFKWYEK